MDPASLLAGLDPAQTEAVTSEASPLCILAGAGSGKTRVLTRRIAWRVANGDADPTRVLALTFTRKAAGELGVRLHRLGLREGVTAGTFHAVAYAQLRQRWADTGTAAPTLLDRKVALLARLMGGRPDRSVQPADLAAEIEWAKARMVTPARYAACAAAEGRRPPMPAASVGALYERYESEKRRRRLVDFDDLLLLCLGAIDTDPDFAAVQQWRFRHFFVDEFQDVNPLQHRLLEAWRGERRDLCVVGDPDQAIYSWNGADAGFLTGFTDRHPGAGVVRLDRNYRSSPQVLSVAASVLGAGPGLRPTEPDGPVPRVESFTTDLDEARAIARALRRLHGPGTPWSHMAVLTRTHAQCALVAEAVRAAGVPYRARGGGFLTQPEVRAALRELEREAARVPLGAALVDLEQRVSEGDAGDDHADLRRANLEALVRLGREYLTVQTGGPVDGFLAWLEATVGDRSHDGGDAVDLATFHAAKGLEWPVVFLAGLERGLVPIGHATGREALAEERRLLYVAATRARRELRCSWARQRTFGTRRVSREPSPFLAHVEAAVAALETPTAARVDFGGLRAAASGRRRPRTRNDGDGMLADLKAWRSATARAAGVPAYVVFPDRTLEAVAEAQPRDHRSLLALPGVGPVKIARYGEAVLEVVARHQG